MGLGISAVGKIGTQTDARQRKALSAQLGRLAFERFSPFSLMPEPADDAVGWRVELFPGSELASLEISATGKVTFDARTSPIGPGFHHRVCEFVREAQAKHGVKWREVADDTEYYREGSFDKLRESFLDWVRALSGSVLQSGPGMHLCMGIGEYYTGDCFAFTPFGGRAREYFEQAANGGPAALEFMAWPDPQPDARCFRLGAEALMWSEVRWRPAMMTGGEDKDLDAMEAPVAQTTRRAIALLERAYAMDAAGPYPWREWAQLYECDQREAPEHVQSRALAVKGPLIGYRRNEIRAAPFGGFSVTVPGAMTSAYIEDAWFAWDGERSVRLCAMDIPPDRRERSPRSSVAAHWEDFADCLEGEPGGRRIKWEDKAIAGRAELRKEDMGGEVGFLLQGAVHRVERIAVCTVVYREESDFPWAEKVFRSIEIASP